MEKKEDAGAKLNVLLCNLVDYVRRDDRPLVFAVMLEITEYFEQELDKAREEVLIELQKEFSEFGVPDDVRYTQPLFYINEVIEKKLSNLKTKEDGK